MPGWGQARGKLGWPPREDRVMGRATRQGDWELVPASGSGGPGADGGEDDIPGGRRPPCRPPPCRHFPAQRRGHGGSRCRCRAREARGGGLDLPTPTLPGSWHRQVEEYELLSFQTAPPCLLDALLQACGSPRHVTRTWDHPAPDSRASGCTEPMERTLPPLPPGVPQAAGQSTGRVDAGPWSPVLEPVQLSLHEPRW